MKVGVIGAGVGGLSLARNLQYFKNCGVASVKVFEKSTVLKPALGGALGLHGGTVCLAKAGLGTYG
jgi:2-polyprenyl-6-methoxyphenol hydroxylase-like FAD-dependent oxidoreductase